MILETLVEKIYEKESIGSEIVGIGLNPKQKRQLIETYEGINSLEKYQGNQLFINDKIEKPIVYYRKFDYDDFIGKPSPEHIREFVEENFNVQKKGDLEMEMERYLASIDLFFDVKRIERKYFKNVKNKKKLSETCSTNDFLHQNLKSPMEDSVFHCKKILVDSLVEKINEIIIKGKFKLPIYGYVDGSKLEEVGEVTNYFDDIYLRSVKDLKNGHISIGDGYYG